MYVAGFDHLLQLNLDTHFFCKLLALHTSYVIHTLQLDGILLFFCQVSNHNGLLEELGAPFNTVVGWYEKCLAREGKVSYILDSVVYHSKYWNIAKDQQKTEI